MPLLLAGICAHGIPSGQQIPFLSYGWRFWGAPNVSQHACLTYPVVGPNVRVSDVKNGYCLGCVDLMEIISALFLTFTLAHGHAGLPPPLQQTLWRYGRTPSHCPEAKRTGGNKEPPSKGNEPLIYLTTSARLGS